ncbi:sigma factor-like helix-turn-helix DNA-binding protein [Fimbriiglobus ruber]|uniref:sigma factor-like helix-turn-helix DNA-binding protein n=1 Tax=Fimbriiglobus ruber TaxID=1908690 RepID=UPI000B4B4414|nr:sigma factor-like helix-turn-helix DNA-binding protein [Fimbriiglobus ruber]
MSETTRLVFLMRVEGELSFADVAAALDTTEEAARWHMHQARTKLQKRLGARDRADLA